MLQTYKKFLYNKHKIKHLKVKINAKRKEDNNDNKIKNKNKNNINNNNNNINEENNIKNTTPLLFSKKKLINNTNAEKFCTCSYILKICVWLEESIN